jgi:LmbE family N-acetylglucosaminyl deacetylase
MKYLLLILFSAFAIAQAPKKPNAVDIYHQIEKLNVLASVLYVAAHPDDENTRMISYFANDVKAHTGYLSLTRGDGGQNLIGSELREALGYIRTHELIEARKIDGGVQYFSRANDFGYSKIPDETLKIWSKEEVIEDMIYVIRKHQPDIIINRFDHRSPGTTHGHHTASAQLALEIFDQVSQSQIYPNQLNLVALAQPKRLFFNTSWWFYGGKDKFEKADKSKLYPINIGGYYASQGLSNQEIAALSRSQHQSQGFGSTPTRGEDIEYLELLKGDFSSNKNVFDGIDISWNRIKNGNQIGELVKQIIGQYDFKNPVNSIKELLNCRQMILNLEDGFWKSTKLKDIEQIIYDCSGLYLEAISDHDHYIPGEEANLKLEAINRSKLNINLVKISFNTNQKSIEINQNLDFNTPFYQEESLTFPKSTPITTPYWLEETPNNGMFKVSAQKLIGLPENPMAHVVTFTLKFDNQLIDYHKPIVHKFNSSQYGETYKPLRIVSQASLSFNENVQIISKGVSKKIGVKVKAFKDNLSGELSLNLKNNFEVSPKFIQINGLKKGDEQQFYFEIKTNDNQNLDVLTASLKTDNFIINKNISLIDYPHIPLLQIVKNAETKAIVADLKNSKKTIGYIMGAGDELPKYLNEIGYDVKNLSPEDISNNMNNMSTIIVGIRAYNTLEGLKNKQDLLFEYVNQGGNLIVQYNTTGKLTVDNLAPFELKISRDRVTEEDAKVEFLAPQHAVLNTPHQITDKDFLGWVQEQGLYYPNQWGKEFTSILKTNDTNESPKTGALLIAKYGKGHYIYTGLSFFRQIPAGVLGAYRLLINLIELR